MAIARYKEIVDALADRIGKGELKPGDRLPSVRALMQMHGLALATAARVYDELEAVGLVVGECGRGTFVRDLTLPRSAGMVHRTAAAGVFDLTFSYPTLTGQDTMLREGLRNIAAQGDLDALLHSAPPGGRPHERQMIARHLRNRGIRVQGEQVLIVSGASQGLAIAAMALLKPGDVLAVDSLTYPGMLALARAQRLDVKALPLTAGGTDLDALERLCKRHPVRAVYSMPTMHNPLGFVMSESDRSRLGELARHHDFLIIEDAAYAFLAEPAPMPIQAHAPDRTVYVSSMSKSIAAGLRVGFVVAPLAWVSALEQAARISTWQASSVPVALACHWIESGLVDALEDRKRSDARSRQRVARRVLSDCTVVAHHSSYYLWIELPQGARADGVAADLAQQGVLVMTAKSFAATHHAPQALRLALGALPLEALDKALHSIKAVLASA